MKRMNYAGSAFEHLTGISLTALPLNVRLPLAAFGITMVATGFCWGVEEARIDAALRSAEAYAARAAALDPAADRARAAAADVARLRTVARTIRDAEGSGARSAGRIARITGALPDDVWLSAIRTDKGTVSLEGRALHLEGVANALDALGRLDEYAGVRLTSARSEARRASVIYGLALDPAR
ncbi:MAG TPA: PilN domain-containing protein [Candidatus Baltobacteraceae bacterium]|nr:PilN domain-containing protein [Candidatus Baltobacteraceae bacterium]